MAIQSIGLDRTWTASSLDKVTADLFTGTALFIKSSEPDKALNLRKDPPVHTPIPNTWWIQNRIHPGFADSPLRDPDGDGFSNREEFDAGTDPNVFKSHPPLIAKLRYVKDISLGWVLRPRPGSQGRFPFAYEDTNGKTNVVRASQMIGVDELFFENEPMKGRFKLLGSEVRTELNTRINIQTEVTIVRIEDQRPNKKGTVYELPSPLAEDRKRDFIQYDRTAVLSLEAIGLAGQEFNVEENTPFSLPANGSSKDYLLKTVKPEAITVEYTDTNGKRQTVEIRRGALPQKNP
jgi:hypothetical protein